MESTQARTYTSQQAANLTGIGLRTLYRWVRELKLLAEPERVQIGRFAYRIWTDQDLINILHVREAVVRGRPKAKGQALSGS